MNNLVIASQYKLGQNIAINIDLKKLLNAKNSSLLVLLGNLQPALICELSLQFVTCKLNNLIKQAVSD